MDRPADSPLLPFKSIIYATDFSASSSNAGDYAALLAKRFGAEFVAAHAFLLTGPAMEVEAQGGPVQKSAQRVDLEAALASVAAQHGEGVTCTSTALIEGDPREAIPRLAKDRAPSLVVLGTEGRGRVSRGIVGSIAERILRANEWPSLTVGPAAPACERNGTPFRRVLYATGLSPAAARGAAYAAAMAEAFDASLEVLHLVHPEDLSGPGGLSAIKKRFETILREVAPRTADTLGNPQAVIEVGSAHERIPKRLRESPTDLLVLSIRKSSHLWLAARVSGAFHIIANAPCPVLTITG